MERAVLYYTGVDENEMSGGKGWRARGYGLSDRSHPPPLTPRPPLLLPLNGLPGSSAWLPSPSSKSLSWSPPLPHRPPLASPLLGRRSLPDRPPSFCLAAGQGKGAKGA